jgi:AMP nucleosidase
MKGAPSRETIVSEWLPRYTGTPLADFGKLVLLTNFFNYVEKFGARMNTPIMGIGGPMQACTSLSGITMINFGIGSPNAATVMDLLSAIDPDVVLFLGKCGGLKTGRTK